MSHFYIGNLDEKKEVDKNPEWKLEGVAYNAGKYNKSQNKCETQDQSPVYRFHSKEYMSHFYSINKAEADYITSNYPEDLWKYEGIEFCAYPNKADGTFGVHRFWSAEYENHFFTTNNAEKDYVIKNYTESTWKYEGIAFYVE